MASRHAVRRSAFRPRAKGQSEIEQLFIIGPRRAADVIALDDALKHLAEFDDRKSQIVVLRFFGGLSIDETAAVLDVSPGTVMRDWTLAKAWLRKEISRRDA